MMGIHPALKCFNKRKCRFLTPCFYVCKRPVSISVKRGFYARKIPSSHQICIMCSAEVAKNSNVTCDVTSVLTWWIWPEAACHPAIDLAIHA